jgi:hypothetical protein
LNTGFGLLAELLSFASPKESKQRKGELTDKYLWLAACLLPAASLTFLCFAKVKVSKRKARFLIPVSACWPSYFLLLRQKKVTKEKASQRPWPYRATLRYSRRAGPGANSLRSNKRPP